MPPPRTLAAAVAATLLVAPAAHAATDAEDRRPGTPTGLRVETPSVQRPDGVWLVDDLDPYLSAVVRDPDRDHVAVRFRVVDVATGDLVDRGLTSWRASGSRVDFRIGSLQEAGEYEVVARGVDDDGRRSKRWSEPLRLLIDTIGPQEVPLVHTVAGYEAEYLEEQYAGGVGQTGGFMFEYPGGLQDLDHIRYSFESETLHKQADEGETITYTPRRSGPHTLYFQAVDEAGNLGEDGYYTFYVSW